MFKIAQQHLQIHIDSVHVGKKPYKCSQCPSTFGRSGHLKRHVLVVHESDNPFKCDVCNASFTQNGHLQKHLNFAHGRANAKIAKKNLRKGLKPNYKDELDIGK